MNLAILMGRLTDTPELRKTNSGLSVTSFSIAINRRFKQDGEQQTDFINCVAWRQTAEFIANYFTKGSMIAVEGSIQTRKYTDRDGNNRTATEVVVNQAHFTGSKRDADGAGSSYNRNEMPREVTPSYSNAVSGDFSEIADDDDLPF